MAEKYSRSIKIMQMNLLKKKMDQRKDKIKFIFNFSSTKIFSKYYINLIKNILVIQKYIKVNLNQKDIIKQINQDYFTEEPNDLLMSENKDAMETLFPLALEEENTEDNEDEASSMNNGNKMKDKNKSRGKGKKPNGKNNFDKNSTLNMKDSSLLPKGKQSDYHGLTISDNKSPNMMTSLDKTKNLKSTKNNNKNGNNNYYKNNNLDSKTLSYNNHTMGYNNKNNLKNTFSKKPIPENENFLTGYPKSKNMNYKKYINEMKNKQNLLKNELIPKYFNYRQATITVFAKILDIDIINDSNEIEDKSWSEEYIYLCIRFS